MGRRRSFSRSGKSSSLLVFFRRLQPHATGYCLVCVPRNLLRFPTASNSTPLHSTVVHSTVVHSMNGRRIRVEPLIGDSSTLIEELKDAEAEDKDKDKAGNAASTGGTGGKGGKGKRDAAAAGKAKGKGGEAAALADGVGAAAVPEEDSKDLGAAELEGEGEGEGAAGKSVGKKKKKKKKGGAAGAAGGGGGGGGERQQEQPYRGKGVERGREEAREERERRGNLPALTQHVLRGRLVASYISQHTCLSLSLGLSLS